MAGNVVGRGARRAVRTLGVALVLLVALVAPGAAQDGGGVVPPGQEGKIPPGSWTQDQIDQLLQLIADTEATLPATFPSGVGYDELMAALGPLGYHDFGIAAPGDYLHFINRGWLDGSTLDPAHPESLVYQGRYPDVVWPEDPADWDDFVYPEPTYHLVSAMYMLGTDFTVDDIPADLAWLPGWHTHGDLCASPSLTFAGFAPCSGDSVPLDHAPMMHVWITEYGCDHRFGGIDQGGLHCDVMHHASEHEHEMEHESEHEMEHEMEMTTTTTSSGTGGAVLAEAEAAAPIAGTPNVTG